MKKIIVILLAVVAIYSCSKKTTTTKSVANAKVNETQVTTSQKMDTNSGGLVLQTPATPTSESTDPTAPSKAELAKKGKVVYEAKCGRCHDLKATTAYDEVKWVKIVDWMAPKAKLEADEKEVVLAYVTLNAKK